MATPLAPWGLILSRLDRVVFDPDVTAPSVPVLNAAVVFDQTRIDLSWSTSVDPPPNPSGLAGYDVQIDGSTVVSVGVQTAYSAINFVASSMHTFRVRSRDLANNVSGYSNQVSATTSAATTLFNPTFPRLASAAFGGTQAYADPTLITAMSKRHVNLVTHFPGWQNFQGGGTSMASVCQQVKAASAIGSRMYVYIIYSQVGKDAATAPSAGWEIWQYATLNTQFAYTNGLTHTGPLDSQDGPTTSKLNFTTAINPVVNGKTFAKWYIDWTKGLNYSGASISIGSISRSAANNPYWDGTFFDNVWQQERLNADYDCNGTLDGLTATSSKNLIRASHAAAADYFRSVLPGQDVLCNSADWSDEPALPTTVFNQKFDGGLIEGGIGQTFSKENFGSFSAYMAGNAMQMTAYTGAKLGIVNCKLASLTDYRGVRYTLTATLMTNAYSYQFQNGYRSEQLPSLWFDEYDFNLGAALDPEQTAPRFLGGGSAANGEGYWRRDFVNGIAICAGRRGGGALASSDQETPYTTYALGGTFYRLAGMQDSATNNGASLTSIALKPRDGIILRRSPAEVIPPSVPSALSAVATSTQINLTWNASTDTGGSGLAGYKIERSTSSGSGFSQIGTSVAASFVDSTAVGGTPYFYRVRAYDNAGNNSGYSNTATATIVVQQAPVWATVPAVTFTQGIAGNFSLSPYVSDPNSDPLTLTKNAIALPSGVTFDGPNKRYVYDGSGSPLVTTGHIVTASDSGTTSADADWAARLATAGLFAGNRFDTQSELAALIFNDVRAGNVTWDSTTKVSGGGSARIAVNDTDGTNNGAILIPIAPDQRVFGPAQSSKQYCIQYRQRMPSAFCYAAYPGNGPNAPFANGQKHSICSHMSGSNQNNELVIEDTYMMGGPTWYHQDGNSFANDFASVFGGSAFRTQTGIDNGAPPTGAESFSSGVLAQARNRWGLMYSTEDRFHGTPILPMGGFSYLPDEWMTFQIWVDFTGGFNSTRVVMWAAHEGQAPVRFVNGLFVFGTANGGHNALWLLPYCTGRTTNGGFNTNTWYGEVLRGSQLFNFPGGFAVTLA